MLDGWFVSRLSLMAWQAFSTDVGVVFRTLQHRLVDTIR